MTLTDRDRRILIFLLPIALLAGYWFLLLSPKRDDLKAAQDQQAQQEQRLQTAQDRVAQLERARRTFAADYAAVVRLGKAIPAAVDAPSLLVQLSEAADGTRIDFNSVTFGERQAGVTAPATPGPAAAPAGNAAPGGAAAQTPQGTAVEQAGESINQANDTTAQAQQGVDAATQPAQPAGEGEQQTPQSQATPAALESVALTFDFTGSYFDLADFLHRLKRFVYVAGDRIFVRGRLLTIDSMTFSPGEAAAADGTTTDQLTTQIGATVYLSPRAEGTTAGATPAGPGGTAAPPAEQPASGTAKRGFPPTAAGVAGR